ncbi:peptidylprolyl isomerase [Geofilum rubicundum]|nr:peptidylprolyl isomerase [Geofilum rubicundum]
MRWLFHPFLSLLVLLMVACAGGSKKAPEENADDEPRGSYHSNISGMAELHLSDHYTRPVGKAFGFYVGPETVVTNLSEIQGAYRVRVAAPGTTQQYKVEGYTAYDLDLDLVVLKVDRKNSAFLSPVPPIDTVDTLYTLLRPSTDLLVSKTTVRSFQETDSSGYYRLSARLESGKPAFYTDHGLAGIIQKQVDEGGETMTRVLEGKWIKPLLDNQESPQALIGLSNKSNTVYPSYQTIRGFRMVTNMGNITLRLYNETPEYRDNFIKLVTDQFYDSLTVHRVIRGFLIQTGAADTRDAGPQDVVGWRGPGYTLPMNIVPGIFHKRGAIAASKLPDAKNPKDESDGSQFYIVSGRVFTEKELDDLEEQKGIRYTAEQRNVYGTQGGAPHLDGDYTVFGEVTTGMELVDRISLLETYQGDRPVKDVRVLRMEFIYR